MEQRKQISVVANDLCSGCRNCEVWCSFVMTQKQGFHPQEGLIHIETDPMGRLNVPKVNCHEDCPMPHEGDPICVEMCPTGCLIYTDEADLAAKRAQWEEAREQQPVFKLIVPWKYPYPWRPLRREEL